jgi:hypothetical protein
VISIPPPVAACEYKDLSVSYRIPAGHPGRRTAFVMAIAIGILSGCGSSGPGAATNQTRSLPPTATQARSSTPPAQDIMQREPFAPIEPGPYFIDPDGDPSTSLRVRYEVPATGWSMWIGAAKFATAGTTCSDSGCPGNPRHVGMSITTVTNVVRDGCLDHSWADPPVGPSVDDLAAALADLAPFQVTSPERDVAIDGFGGKHLEWTVPDLPVEGAGDDLRFTGCVGGKLKSWVAFVDTAEPGDAFYGYTGPDYTEEFWILDVEGTRLMIAAERSAGSAHEDLAELRMILDSIQIEP